MISKSVEFKLLKTIQDFNNLNKGDLILVKWDRFTVKHTRNCDEIMYYKIHEVKRNQGEVICKLKNNHYFNYDRYLQGLSGAEEVYLIKNMGVNHE